MYCGFFINITMKGGLCIIYTSLLTISVLSSCALFILVVSEALQAEGGVEAKVDLSGLHNVSQKVITGAKPGGGPDPVTLPSEAVSSEPPAPDLAEETKAAVEEQEMIFAEALSLNSVTTDGLPDTGQPPVLISLVDNAKLDLKTPDELLFVNDLEEHNDTKTFAIIDADVLEEERGEGRPAESTEPRLVVKARPMHEPRAAEEAAPPHDEPAESQDEQKDETENIPIKPETPQEDIPSFSEWAQKQLAEAEKKDIVLNHSSQPSHSNTNFSSKSTKLRSKNYASLVCGAKVVAVNPEAGSATAILSPNRDEYMLNTCTSRIWFVVELCEAVQAQKIEIANFELFSSTPKDIAVYFSDRFPTREWASVGQFTAQDMRDVQSFDLYPHMFGKFIKVEMLSHHGSEHYCPISLFKVYGTSEFEVLEKENAQHPAHIDEDEDDEIIDVPDIPATEAEPSKNLFGSARDAVMSIMKKAAQALVKSEVPQNATSESNDSSTDEAHRRCCSPSHIIVCDNCSETLYSEVFDLISCSSARLAGLLRQVFVRDTLKCTPICQPYGLDFKSTNTIEFSQERVAYMNVLFSQKYLAALCNMLAIKEKKVVLNSSFETELNVTTNMTVDESSATLNSEANHDQEIKLTPEKTNGSDERINETVQDEKPSSEAIEENTPVPVELPSEEKATIEDKKEEAIPEDKPAPESETVAAEAEQVDIPEAENKEVPKAEAKNGKEVVVEKTKEGSIGEEGGDSMLIDNDSFMSELDQMAVDPAPAGAPSAASQQQAGLQKESVFLRLSNRVKTLERNMSLSGQYLEELSRRYKKQVEEMQKTFEKTVQQMSEERRKSNEREQKYIEQLSTMQEQVGHMARALTALVEERDSWLGNITLFKFIVLQTIILAVIFYLFNKRRKVEPVIVTIPKKARKKQDKLRRKSVEGVSGHATPAAKKRRPSEEALQIARQCEDTREEEGEWAVARRNRRRKTSIVHRHTETDRAWARQDSIGKLNENPIPLDEEEFFAPVTEPKQFNGSEPPAPPAVKANGSFFNNLKAKTMKTRRLSSPAFLRTLSRQSARSSPSPPACSGAASGSPTGSLWSESTDLSNGQDSLANNNKKKKSLKNILKKVF